MKRDYCYMKTPLSAQNQTAGFSTFYELLVESLCFLLGRHHDLQAAHVGL